MTALDFGIGGHPSGPMGNYLLSHVHNDHLAIFFGFRSTLTTALFRDGARRRHGGRDEAPKEECPSRHKTNVRPDIRLLHWVRFRDELDRAQHEQGVGTEVGSERLIVLEGTLRCQYFPTRRGGVSGETIDSRRRPWTLTDCPR